VSLYEEARFCEVEEAGMQFVAVVVLGLVLVGCGGRGVGTWLGAPADERCEFDDMVGGQVEPGAQELVVPQKKKAWEATWCRPSPRAHRYRVA